MRAAVRRVINRMRRNPQLPVTSQCPARPPTLLPKRALRHRTKRSMATTTHSPRTDWVRQSLKRKEDARLVRGKGKFVDDIKMLGMLHLAFVRSPYAHANITGIDVSEAEALPGVVCTLTGQ